MAVRRPTAPRAAAERAPGRTPPRGTPLAAPPRPQARGGGRAPHRTPNRAPGRPAGSTRPASRPVGRVTAGLRRPPKARPATIVLATLVVFTLLVGPNLRAWMNQRAELAAGRAQVEALQREVVGLQQEKQRWNDPAYVKAQARERLHFVMPGEVGYVIADPAATAPTSTDPRVAAAAVPQGGASTWYRSVWQSARIAGADGR